MGLVNLNQLTKEKQQELDPIACFIKETKALKRDATANGNHSLANFANNVLDFIAYASAETSIPARVQMMQLLSEVRILNRISTKGYLANEQIKTRQASLNAFTEKSKKRHETTLSAMEQREKAMQQAKAIQEHHRATAKKQGRNAIERSKADEAFSVCIRLRANCTCERCGEQFPPNAMKNLHCSHNYSRENKQVRYHPDNAFALCMDCHRWFARNKTESTPWKNEKLGTERLQRLLISMASQSKTITKSEEARIASYYRMAARYLLAQREQGNTDYIPFKTYQSKLAYE